MIVPPLKKSPIPSLPSLMLLRRPQLPRSRQGRIGPASGRAENQRGLCGTRGRVESRQRSSVIRHVIGRLARKSNVSFSYVGRLARFCRSPRNITQSRGTSRCPTIGDVLRCSSSAVTPVLPNAQPDRGGTAIVSGPSVRLAITRIERRIRSFTWPRACTNNSFMSPMSELDRERQ